MSSTVPGSSKMHWKPDAGLPASGLKVHFGMDGTSISRRQKQQSCGKSAKPTGLRPEPGTYGESSSKMQWKPDAGLPARGLEVHFGMDGTSISRGQKQQSCGKSAKPTGLRPEPGT